MANTSVIRSDFYVYALLRGDCTPFYIGMGINARWLQHEKFSDLKNTHKNNAIKKMIKEGWPEIPKIKLATNMTRPEAVQLERDMIRLLGRHPIGPLTNRTDGGEGLWNPDEEARQKMREARKHVVFSAEARAKMSKAQRGRRYGPRSEEMKRHLSAKIRGFKHTPEAVEKIRATSKGRKWSDAHRAKFIASRTGIPMPAHVKEKLRANRLGHKQSTETIAKRMASLEKIRKPQTLEQRAKKSAHAKAQWRRPDIRASTIAKQKALWTPEKKIAAGLKLKEAWVKRKERQKLLPSDSDKLPPKPAPQQP